MAYTIYVTEDDEGIREMIQLVLENFTYHVKVFENAEMTLAAIKKEIPDLFIFDIMLPGIDGLEAVRRLRGHAGTELTPVLLLTAKDTELDKVIGLDSGADDYLVKPFGIMELGARIRALLRRNSKENTAVESGDLRIDLGAREIKVKDIQVDLTYKEFELLYHLAQNADRVVSRDELMEKIWGIDFIGESRTLDTHIKSLRQKLGDEAEHPRYIATIRNVGYRFLGI